PRYSIRSRDQICTWRIVAVAASRTRRTRLNTCIVRPKGNKRSSIRRTHPRLNPALGRVFDPVCCISIALRSCGTTFHSSSSPSQSGLSSPVDSPTSDADSTFPVGLGDSPVEVPQSEYANSSAGYPSDLELEESEFEGSNAEALGSSGELSPAPYAENDAFLPAIGTGPLLEAPNSAQEAGQEPESEGQQDARPVTPENQTGSRKQPVSTPVAGKPASTQDVSVSPTKGPKYLKDLRQAYAMEMRKKIAQVSVDIFMEEFVPGDNLPSNATIEVFDRAGFNRQEKLMYDELCKVANSVFSHVRTARSLIAKDTHCWGDQTDKFDRGSNRCPDVMIYPADGDATKAYTIEPSFLAKKTKEDRQRCVEKEARTAWLWASLLIEAKGNTSDSPFVVPNSKQETNNTPTSPVQQGAAPSVPASDTSSAPLAVSGISSTVLAVSGASSPSLTDSAVPAAANDASPTHDSAPTASAKPPTASVGSKAGAFLRLNAEGGAQTMGQMAEYVSKVLRRRFLSCFFTIFVCREYAWLLRWDRAGLVVSEPFNFLQQPYLLHNFFYRFASMNDVQRGEDPTVIPASAEDATCMRSFNNFKTDYERDAFKAALVDPVRKSLWPVYKILMPEDDMISAADLERGEKSRRTAPGSSSPRMREFLISRPHFMSSSVVGRGTLCHIAYDVSEKRAVFLKQYWRLDFQTHHPEGEVYMRLHSKKVEYIATPIAAGDVRPCGGEPQCTRTQEFLPGTPPKLIQYRLIVEEVAAPLKNYANSRQLVGVIYHATLAHEQAWTQASVLHRDISVNNILIYSYRNDQGRLVVKGLLIDWGLCKYKEELGRPPSQGSRSGTWQFISAVLLAYPGDFGHEVWHDIESFIHVLHWMCFRFHKT
ncbi:hypothetical protein DAEQUDRAFT_88447, partial [Daedalea quercina L-15889]